MVTFKYKSAANVMIPINEEPQLADFLPNRSSKSTFIS